MKCFKMSSCVAVALLATAPASAQNQLSAGVNPVADKIECPLEELEWGVDQSFPDPWWAGSYVETHATGPWTTIWKGKEMLVCSYLTTEGDGWLQPGLYMPPSGGDETGVIFVLRPWVEMPEENYPCPPTLQVKVLSELPSPWLGTTYPWSLVSKQSLPEYGVNVCRYEGERARKILRPVRTDYPDFTSNPPPSIDDLKLGFAVSKAELTAIPSKKTTTCPTTVRFEGRIHVNGPGQVRYRVEENGQVGPLQTIDAIAAGGYALAWESEVGASQKPAAIGGLTTETQSGNVATGQARILIESPDGKSESNVAGYEITCSPLAPVEGLAQTPEEPEPEPLVMVAPQPAQKATPKLQVLQAAPALPDLRIRTATVDRSKPKEVKVRVVNVGQGPSAATQVRVWVIPHGQAWYGQVPPLAAGQDAWATVQTAMPVMAAQKVYARVDDPDKVKESNEGNNGHVVK
ncbi:MAG: CARDB domain-containing protein [Gemmatimonadota bacterium]